MSGSGPRKLGAHYLGEDRCRFRVWAPFASEVELHLLTPSEKRAPLAPAGGGYHQIVLEGVSPGSLYFYRLGNESESENEYPDPASRSQPQGVHGPSEVVDPDFDWSDSGWSGLALHQYLLYEVHVGTYTDEGTFDALIPHLDRIRGLGVTAIELMPVAQFPGYRNWGYDGVFPFAVQSSYGGPPGLKRLVDAGHARGLAVVLDVVYNHLGPEGNYLGQFGPYFTDRYRTPWGLALNYDGADSDEVRRYFTENALQWIDDFHIDALRLDAVHAIVDSSPRPFLEELSVAVGHGAHRRVYLMPESAANDARLIRSRDSGGYGLDAVWNDDFHHSLRALLTGERRGYYLDYGEPGQLAKAFREGFVYSGEYSRFRRRRHGVSSRALPAERFVVFAQNHDQVGNTMRGERLSALVSFEKLKLAAAAVVLSPCLPLLFMGEEYGEEAPFPYFVSHSDPELIEAVRRGRREEFRSFGWEGEPPDPQDEQTFLSARLRHHSRENEPHRQLEDWYREVIRLRREHPPLVLLDKDLMEVETDSRERVLVVRRSTPVPAEGGVCVLYHLGDGAASVSLGSSALCWEKCLDSADSRFLGPGSRSPQRIAPEEPTEVSLGPWSVVVYRGTGAER